MFDFEFDPLWIENNIEEYEKLVKIHNKVLSVYNCPDCKSKNLCKHTKTFTCIDCGKHFNMTFK